MLATMEKFKPGQTVKFKDGYGSRRLYCFLFEHTPQTGHCTIMSLGGDEILTMIHTELLREATEEEC